MSHLKAKRGERAEANLTRAVESWNTVAAHPSCAIQDRVGLGLALMMLGDYYQDADRPAKAEEWIQKAIPLLEELADKEKTREFAEGAAENLTKLAHLQALNDHRDEAVKTLLRAKGRYAALIRDHPDQIGYANDLVDVLEDLAEIHGAGRKADLVEACHVEAIGVLDKVVRAKPGNLAMLDRLGEIRGVLGILYHQDGRLDLAETMYGQAIEARSAVAKGRPGRVPSLVSLAGTECNRACAGQCKKADEALAGYGRAAELLELALKAAPGDKTAVQFLTNTLSGRAGELFALGRHDAALKDWDQLAALHRGALPSRFRVSRAKSLAMLGRHEEAVFEAKAAVAHESARGEDIRQAAEVPAAASRAAGANPSLPAPQRAALGESYAALAVGWLREAARRGLDDAAMDLDDVHLDPLRSRGDFRALRKAPSPAP